MTTWHPVSETPPGADRYWTRIQYAPTAVIRSADWRARCRCWEDQWGNDVTSIVTHWRVMEFPEPPEGDHHAWG